MGKWIIDFLFTSSLLILAILALRVLLRGKISMLLQYAMWLVVAVKLLIFPVPWIESSLSVLNLTESITTTKTQEPNTRPESAPNGESQALASGAADFNHESDYIWKPEAINPDALSGNAADLDVNSDVVSENTPDAQNITVFTFLKQYWEPIFCVIAGVGNLFMFALFAVSDFRLQALLKKNRIPYEQKQVSLPVYLIAGLPSPCLYKKAIYITPEVAGDERKLKHVLAHENCHYKHRDGFWSMLRLICLAGYWWHPLVWAAAYLSKQDCELACDETVIRQLGETERIAYGWTLIGLIPQKAEPKDYFSLSTTMTGGGKQMKQRITKIAKQPKVMIPASIALVLLVGLVLLCTITGKKQDAGSGESDAAIIGVTSLEASEESNTTATDTEASETSDENTTTPSGSTTSDPSTGTETTPPEQDENHDSTVKETQAIFHQLVTEGGMYYLNVYQIICDKNADDLSDKPDIISQYQLDELLAKDTIPNTLIYRLAENYDTEYAVHYNQLCSQQEIAWERLLLAPDCHYYIAKTVGSLDKTEVDYEEFISYFLEYDTQGKKCQVFFENGYIHEIFLIDPYKDIVFLNIRNRDHYFYEEYGTEEYYELAATYEADVEHTVDHSGSEKEVIEVYSGDVGDGGNGIVLIKNASGEVIWEIEAHTVHVGWNNIYLTEVDGKEYLMELHIDCRHHYGGYSYYVYSLEQQTGVWDSPVHVSGAWYSYGSIEELKEGNYELWADAMNPYLEHATLLLSTQDGVIRTEPVNEYDKYNKEALVKDIIQE